MHVNQADARADFKRFIVKPFGKLQNRIDAEVLPFVINLVVGCIERFRGVQKINRIRACLLLKKARAVVANAGVFPSIGIFRIGSSPDLEPWLGELNGIIGNGAQYSPNLGAGVFSKSL